MYWAQATNAVDQTVGIAEAISTISGPALLVLGIFLLHKGYIVLGREYKALNEDRNFWRDTAVRALNIGEAVAKRRRWSSDLEDGDDPS